MTPLYFVTDLKNEARRGVADVSVHSRPAVWESLTGTFGNSVAMLEMPSLLSASRLETIPLAVAMRAGAYRTACAVCSEVCPLVWCTAYSGLPRRHEPPLRHCPGRSRIL